MPEVAQPQALAAQDHDDGTIAPAFDEEMSIREMTASFFSNKGALTRLTGQIKVRAETFVAIKFPTSATPLNEACNKFLAKCNFLHRADHQLALADEANAQTWKMAQAQLQPLQETIESIYRVAQVQVGVATQPQETDSVAPGASQVWVRMDLIPWDLAANANPKEFRRWRRKFEQSYLGSDMGVTNIPGQQAALAGCLAADIEQYLYSFIGDNNTPIFTREPNDDEVTSCMDYIYQLIMERHPLDT